MSWLSNRQLINKVRKNGTEATKKSFLGVYAIDKLPKFIPHLPMLLIVNTHSHNLGGEHWKAIFIDKNRNGEVFDSLAQPTSNILIRWMNRFTRKWRTNSKSYQHDKSSTCGAYSLYYVLSRLALPSLDAFCRSFSPALHVNERNIRSFYRRLK